MAMLSVRVNDKDKKEFEAFCEETGLNVSTAINIFIKTVIREKQLPFRITTDPFYSIENIKHLENAIDDLKNHRNLIEHELIEDEE